MFVTNIIILNLILKNKLFALIKYFKKSNNFLEIFNELISWENKFHE